MSSETTEFLRDHIRVGFTDEWGYAWWAGEEPLADGTHFEGPVPVEEAKRILDVPLVSASLEGFYRDGRRKVHVADPDRQLIVNKNTGDILGVFKKGYKIHPYQPWTLGNLSAITDTGTDELGIKSVGLLRNSAQAFLQLQLSEGAREVHGFGYQPFLLAATSCDGSLATTYARGSTAVVCDNTLHWALSDALDKFKERHTSNSLGKLDEVRAKLSIMVGELHKEGDEFEAEIERLLAVDVSDNDFKLWLDEVVPLPDTAPKSPAGKRSETMRLDKRAELTRLYTEDDKAAPWTGTPLGVQQAWNTWNTWQRMVQSAPGGRIERNLSNLVKGQDTKDDKVAMDALAGVLSRRGVTLAA